MEYLTWFMSLWADMPAWLAAITSVVTAANAITAMTPTKVDNRILAGILNVLNVLSVNVFRNKNADA